MTELLAIVSLGFFLGMRHATDADHVIAVSTIVARHRTMTGAALIGAAWGLGHTLTIFVVGAGIILFGWVIPAHLGLSMELSVAVMLIVLGLMNLSGVFKHIRATVTPGKGLPGHVHTHAHSHGDYVHTHIHGHDPETHPHPPERTPIAWIDRHLSNMRAYQLVRPLVVGVVHGLAGSAAVALLVMATIAVPAWSVLYLLVFGLGTIVGMMLMTAMIAVPFAFGGARVARVQNTLRVASGAISLAFGLYLAYQVGLVGGLLTGSPDWTPR